MLHYSEYAAIEEQATDIVYNEPLDYLKDPDGFAEEIVKLVKSNRFEYADLGLAVQEYVENCLYFPIQEKIREILEEMGEL